VVITVLFPPEYVLQNLANATCANNSPFNCSCSKNNFVIYSGFSQTIQVGQAMTITISSATNPISSLATSPVQVSVYDSGCLFNVANISLPALIAGAITLLSGTVSETTQTSLSTELQLEFTAQDGFSQTNAS